MTGVVHEVEDDLGAGVAERAERDVAVVPVVRAGGGLDAVPSQRVADQ
jgi:hypothetical protein